MLSLLAALALLQLPQPAALAQSAFADAGVDLDDEPAVEPQTKTTGQPPVDATSDELEVDQNTQHTLLEGHARLYTRGVLLRGDQVIYDPGGKTAHGEGNVLLTFGLFGASADSVDVDLEHHLSVLHGATLYQKHYKVSPAAMAQVDTAQGLRLLGTNVLTLRADVVRRLGARHYQADTIWLTACDCHQKDWLTEPPSWSVRGHDADIEAGDRLTMSWGRLLIKDVPTVPVPYLFLPLSDRQTGFLLPHPNYTANNGYQVEEPFFWAINKWADATFEPGYFFGTDHNLGVNSVYTATLPGLGPNPITVPRPDPAYFIPDDNAGMRGPRLGYELRYVPSADTHGILTGAFVYDTKDQSNAGANPEVRGVRGDFGWIHDQKLPDGFSDHLEIQTVSDQRYFADVTPDVISASAQYLRSDARVDHHSESTDAYLATSYYQDFDAPRPLGSLGPLLGAHDVNADTFQRFPALGFTYDERTIGPAAVSLETSAAQYSPFGWERAPPSPDGGLDRQVSDRIDLAPQVRVPLTFGRFAEVAPYASVHEDMWMVDGATTSERTYAEVGTTAQTELARVFQGDGAMYRNVITPMAEVRAVPWVRSSTLGGSPSVLAPGLGGGGPVTANDEFDNALPATGRLFQTIVAVRTRLDKKVGKVVTTPLHAEIGQGYDLLGGRAADSYVSLGVNQGPAVFNGMVRYDPVRKTVDDINTTLTLTETGRALNDPFKGSNVTITYQRMGYGLDDPARATLAELVGTAPPLSLVPNPVAGIPNPNIFQADQLGLNGVWKASSGLGINIGGLYFPHVAFTPLGQLTAPNRRDQIADGVANYHLGFDYGSPCGCWGLHAAAIFQPTVSTEGAALRASSSWYSPLAFTFSLDAQRISAAF